MKNTMTINEKLNNVIANARWNMAGLKFAFMSEKKLQTTAKKYAAEGLECRVREANMIALPDNRA